MVGKEKLSGRINGGDRRADAPQPPGRPYCWRSQGRRQPWTGCAESRSSRTAQSASRRQRRALNRLRSGWTADAPRRGEARGERSPPDSPDLERGGSAAIPFPTALPSVDIRPGPTRYSILEAAQGCSLMPQSRRRKATEMRGRSAALHQGLHRRVDVPESESNTLGDARLGGLDHVQCSVRQDFGRNWTTTLHMPDLHETGSNIVLSGRFAC